MKARSCTIGKVRADAFKGNDLRYPDLIKPKQSMRAGSLGRQSRLKRCGLCESPKGLIHAEVAVLGRPNFLRAMSVSDLDRRIVNMRWGPYHYYAKSRRLTVVPPLLALTK